MISSTRYLSISLFLVILADFFFFGQPMGWTYGLFGLLLLLALPASKGNFRRLPRWLCSFAICLIAALIWDPGPLACTLLIGILVCLALHLRLGPQSRLWDWLHLWRCFLLRGWWRIFADSAIAYRAHKRRRLRAGGLTNHSGFAWLLPAALAAVFIAMFSLANPVFAQIVNGSFHILPGIPSFSRIVFWLLFAVWIWALQRFRCRTRQQTSRLLSAGDKTPGVIFSAELVLRSLIVFNLIFALQTVLDFYYLWGGGNLPEGMTYAQYAHRGSYPLIVTALLAAFFILVTFSKASNHSRTAHQLVYLWILQNVFLTISSGFRLKLYVDAYYLTVLRVAAAIWVFLVAMGLILILVRTFKNYSNEWLLSANLSLAFMILFSCSFLNIRGGVAWYNVHHSLESATRLDFDYLEVLGSKALPALTWLAEDGTLFRLSIEAKKSAARLRRELHEEHKNWRGHSIRNYLLYQEFGQPVESAGFGPGRLKRKRER